MKKLFTFLGAMLLWQTMAVAQNFLHVYEGEDVTVVRFADLDSVTVRDAAFYEQGEDTSEWETMPTGAYEFTILMSGAVAVDVCRRQVSEGEWQYKLVDWFVEGYDLIIDYQPSTGACRVVPQETGYIHPTYGMIWVQDAATYSGNPDYVSFFDEETNMFNLYLVYFCNAGRFGAGYEYLKLDYANGATPMRNAQSVAMDAAGKQLKPLNEMAPVVPKRALKGEDEAKVNCMQMQVMPTREITE